MIVKDYEPRYIAHVYYAPDDPHVTNPSQPGYVGSNAPGGGYSGSGSPAYTYSAPGDTAPADQYNYTPSGDGGPSFSDGNYVQDNGDGSYTVVYGGQAISTGDKSSSENYFNSLFGAMTPGNGSSNGSAPSSFASGATGGSALADALMNGGGGNGVIGSPGYTGSLDQPSRWTVHPPGLQAPIDQAQFSSHLPMPPNPDQMNTARTFAMSTGLPLGQLAGSTAEAVPGGMDAQNFVAPDPSNPGKYVVVVKGVRQTDNSGYSSWDRNFAEQVYNNARGLGSGPAAPKGVNPTVNPTVLTPDAQYWKTQADQLKTKVDSLNDAYQKAQIQSAQTLRQDTLAKNQNDILANFLGTVFKQGPGPFGASYLPIVQSLAKALNIPLPDSLTAGPNSSVNPDNISPAIWDQLPKETQMDLMNDWVNAGGNADDFLARINAQRPAGRHPSGPPRIIFA
ncbi:MAG TPA: hypothetical protein VFB90_01120 [Dehalococcoidia bacterium]|nr:hypothetical protein [Dehalococcoidia bacterium]